MSDVAELCAELVTIWQQWKELGAGKTPGAFRSYLYAVSARLCQALGNTEQRAAILAGVGTELQEILDSVYHHSDAIVVEVASLFDNWKRCNTVMPFQAFVNRHSRKIAVRLEGAVGVQEVFKKLSPEVLEAWMSDAWPTWAVQDGLAGWSAMYHSLQATSWRLLPAERPSFRTFLAERAPKLLAELARRGEEVPRLLIAAGGDVVHLWHNLDRIGAVEVSDLCCQQWADRIVRLYVSEERLGYMMRFEQYLRVLVRVPRTHEEFEIFLSQLECEPSVLEEFITGVLSSRE